MTNFIINQNYKNMSLQILTKEDLLNFKIELLAELKTLMKGNESNKKKWLRSKEVEQLLKISSGTLQNYRINGTIKWRKIGSTYFYCLDALNDSFDDNSFSPVS